MNDLQRKYEWKYRENLNRKPDRENMTTKTQKYETEIEKMNGDTQRRDRRRTHALFLKQLLYNERFVDI